MYNFDDNHLQSSAYNEIQWLRIYHLFIIVVFELIFILISHDVFLLKCFPFRQFIRFHKFLDFERFLRNA